MRTVVETSDPDALYCIDLNHNPSDMPLYGSSIPDHVAYTRDQSFAMGPPKKGSPGWETFLEKQRKKRQAEARHKNTKKYAALAAREISQLKQKLEKISHNRGVAWR